MARASGKAKAAADAGVLEKVIAAVQSKQGGDALRRVGDRPREKPPIIPSWSLGLDMALEIGGLPRGKLVEVYGDTGNGKTTAMLHLAANAQEAGLSVAYVDAEHRLDLGYAERLGVDVDNLILSQPSSGEKALDVVAAICDAAAENPNAPGVPGLVIVDSVAALVPQAELEGDNEQAGMALQARMIGKGVRKIVATAAAGNVCVVFINQTRVKVGVMFGNPETTPGGNALKFFTSIRIRLGSAGYIEVGGKENRVGKRVSAKVEKNTYASPFRTVEYDLVFGKGVDHIGEVLDHCVARGIVEIKGTHLSLDGESIGQGRPKAKENLASPQHAATLAKLEAKLAAHFAANGFQVAAKGKKGDNKDEPPHDPETGEVTA